jgi:hypothetical protein
MMGFTKEKEGREEEEDLFKFNDTIEGRRRIYSNSMIL